jgi:formylglycine-generating enzyme required for sulfatase activity
MKPKRICSPVSALLVAAVIFFGGALPAKAMEFVLIPGGTFTMGSPAGEVGHQNNETQHQVKVSDFYIAEYEVTVAEFRKFVAAKGYQWNEGTQGEANDPVVNVSWNDAVAYCKALSAKTGKRCRLPTEAEWEYACRAGSRTPFNTGQNLTTGQANYNGNYPYNGNPKGVYRQKIVPVNTFAPNRWGLYNMHGNVWEWCSDWYSETYYDECKAQGVVTNPTGPSTRSRRVIRGGGWSDDAEYCRSAYRSDNTPDYRSNGVCFRPVFVP